MPNRPRPLVAGNWKMNGASASLQELMAIGQGFMSGLDAETEALLCVPATLLSRASEILSRTPIRSGGQDCHWQQSGPHTGDISAEMLKDAGASHVIVGHSERRTDHGEDDALVAAKVAAALRHGLTPILCVGEGLDVREAGRHVEHTLAQVDAALDGVSTDDAAGIVIAYEPVWAIGTGKVATPDDAQEVCGAIRRRLRALYDAAVADRVRILYGGSVNAKNVGELMAQPDVDGGLVGGASLDADGFAALCKNAG